MKVVLPIFSPIVRTSPPLGQCIERDVRKGHRSMCFSVYLCYLFISVTSFICYLCYLFISVTSFKLELLECVKILGENSVT